MLTTILVPLDGSALAERALPYAVTLARAAGGRLVLFHASTTRALGSSSEPQLAAIESLNAVADALRADGVPVETQITRVYFTDIPQAIHEAALAQEAELIVMSTHGRGGLGRWLYGSVADQVLRQTETPVLLVPPGSPAEWSKDGKPTVLVPLDGSKLAEQALGPAVELADALDAGLLLFQAVEMPSYALYAEAAVYVPFEPEEDLAAAERYLEDVARPLRAAGKDVSVHAEIGQPGWAIGELARTRGVAAIAMATHGRGGLARLVMGSVATATLQKVGVPLLLVRPVEMRQPAIETPPAEPVPVVETTAVPTTTLELSLRELELLERGLAELVFKPERDWHAVPMVRALLERVRTAERTVAETARQPVGAP